MTPLILEDSDDGEILGVNTVDINPAHQLLAFGVDGNGTVHFLDPRSRTRVGLLRLPRNRLSPTGAGVAGSDFGISVTAISSRADGLSYAVGTSTGHTLLYDIRAAKPFALKDQGYGLPIKNVCWIEGGSRMAGDGMIVSADKKVIKIWDRNSPTTNFAAITPANDLNDVYHVPGSGLLMAANEGIQMATYYIPQLGPAPRWASFLENITEEMEDQTTRSVYEDYKFVERKELKMFVQADHCEPSNANQFVIDLVLITLWAHLPLNPTCTDTLSHSNYTMLPVSLPTPSHMKNIERSRFVERWTNWQKHASDLRKKWESRLIRHLQRRF